MLEVGHRIGRKIGKVDGFDTLKRFVKTLRSRENDAILEMNLTLASLAIQLSSTLFTFIIIFLIFFYYFLITIYYYS